jgi:hypothetical protein
MMMMMMMNDMITILYVVSIIELMILERPTQQITVRTTPSRKCKNFSWKKNFFRGKFFKKKGSERGELRLLSDPRPSMSGGAKF